MEYFTDQAIILGLRTHGENGAVAALLTQEQGRHAGYVHGGMSSKKRGQLEPGTHVQVEWRARTHEQLGTYTLEPVRSYAATVMDDPVKLSVVLSACSLCETALPEREGHPGLYHGLIALFDSLSGDHWGAVYVAWELALLKDLGFSLDLTRCALGGNIDDLAYVSPRTGRAVSLEKAQGYENRLLKLPEFLKPARVNNNQAGSDSDIVTGLRLTGHFLENWVYAHHSKGVPDARSQLQARLVHTLEKSSAAE